MKKKEPSFHRSVIVVALLHLGFLVLIIYLIKPPKKIGDSVTWLETGSFGGASAGSEENSVTPQEEFALEEEKNPTDKKESQEPLTPKPEPEPPGEPTPEPPSNPEPVPTPEPSPIPPPSTDSEIPIAAPTPKPAPITPPVPAPKAAPKPILKPKTKPKPKKKEEKEEKKTTSSPKPKSTPSHKTNTSSTAHKRSSSATPKKSSEKKGHSDRSNDNLKKAFLNSKTGNGDGTESSGNGSGSHGNSVNPSALAGYHDLIHDRFYSQWEQPTAIPTEHRHDFICTLRLTIERDGTISNFSLAKPSGNPIMDESVLAAAAKVKQIAPLPEGLSQSAPYTVNINFELE